MQIQIFLLRSVTMQSKCSGQEFLQIASSKNFCNSESQNCKGWKGEWDSVSTVKDKTGTVCVYEIGKWRL